MGRRVSSRPREGVAEPGLLLIAVDGKAGHALEDAADMEGGQARLPGQVKSFFFFFN